MDGESKIFTNVVKKWARTPLSRAKNSKNKWAEWLGRGERDGDKGAKEFCPGWRHQPGQKGAFYPGWWLQPGQKAARAFCPSWCLQSGQKAPVPPLARLAVGPGTKVTYCPGPKGCRDKWCGTKIYSVVVQDQWIWLLTNFSILFFLQNVL